MTPLHLLTTLTIISILPVFKCQSQITRKEQNIIVDLHNGYRRLQRARDMKKLTWDDSLASEAQTWADRCIYDFRLKLRGENMYYFESKLPNDILVERAIDAWYSERYSWTMSGDCTDACSYTQLVWAKTKRLGCAIKKCGSLTLPEEVVANAWFMYCVYDPKGNTFGEYPFRQGPECSMCDGNETCSQQLCIENQKVIERVPPRLQSVNLKRENPVTRGKESTDKLLEPKPNTSTSPRFRPWSQQRIDVPIPSPPSDPPNTEPWPLGENRKSARIPDPPGIPYEEPPPQPPQPPLFKQAPQQPFFRQVAQPPQQLLIKEVPQPPLPLTISRQVPISQQASDMGYTRDPAYTTLLQPNVNPTYKTNSQTPVQPIIQPEIRARPILAVRHFRITTTSRTLRTSPPKTTTQPTTKTFQRKKVLITKTSVKENKFSLGDIRKNKTTLAFKFEVQPTQKPINSESSPKARNETAAAKSGFVSLYSLANSNSTTVVVEPPTPPQDSADNTCEDRNQYCKHWKVYCQGNAYVYENCRKSCKACNIPQPPISGIPKKTLECKDQNEYCPHWKKFCFRNKYVTSRCQKQCGTCKDMPAEIQSRDIYPGNMSDQAISRALSIQFANETATTLPPDPTTASIDQEQSLLTNKTSTSPSRVARQGMYMPIKIEAMNSKNNPGSGNQPIYNRDIPVKRNSRMINRRLPRPTQPKRMSNNAYGSNQMMGPQYSLIENRGRSFRGHTPQPLTDYTTIPTTVVPSSLHTHHNPMPSVMPRLPELLNVATLANSIHHLPHHKQPRHNQYNSHNNQQQHNQHQHHQHKHQHQQHTGHQMHASHQQRQDQMSQSNQLYTATSTVGWNYNTLSPNMNQQYQQTTPFSFNTNTPYNVQNNSSFSVQNNQPYGPASNNPPYGSGSNNPPYGSGSNNPPYGSGSNNPPYGSASNNPPYSSAPNNPSHAHHGGSHNAQHQPSYSDPTYTPQNKPYHSAHQHSAHQHSTHQHSAHQHSAHQHSAHQHSAHQHGAQQHSAHQSVQHHTPTNQYNNPPNNPSYSSQNSPQYNEPYNPLYNTAGNTALYTTPTHHPPVGNAPPSGSSCVDGDYRCASWAEYCGRNPYTDQTCLKTCHYC